MLDEVATPCRLIARPVRLEAAVPVPDGQKQPMIHPRFSVTRQITQQVFERIRHRLHHR